MRHAWTAGLILACAARAESQQRDSLGGTGPILLDRTYLFFNMPHDKTHEWYEAQLAIHLPVLNNVQSRNDLLRKGARRWYVARAFTVTMLSTLRQTRDTSAPVRTPSYSPRGTLQLFWLRRTDASTAVKARNASSIQQISLSTTLAHYSNGQDGCLWTNQHLPDCSESAPPVKVREVNRKDGSFSSHFVQVGLAYQRQNVSTTLPASPEVTANELWTFGAQVRAFQPLSWLGGGMTKELRDAYGPLRIAATIGRVTQSNFLGTGQWRTEGMVEYIAGAPEEVPRIRASIEAAHTFDKKGGWGAFARLYRGQDYYNLGFLTDIRVLQLGVTTGGERMPRYRIDIM